MQEPKPIIEKVQRPALTINWEPYNQMFPQLLDSTYEKWKNQSSSEMVVRQKQQPMAHQLEHKGYHHRPHRQFS